MSPLSWWIYLYYDATVSQNSIIKKMVVYNGLIISMITDLIIQLKSQLLQEYFMYHLLVDIMEMSFRSINISKVTWKWDVSHFIKILYQSRLSTVGTIISLLFINGVHLFCVHYIYHRYKLRLFFASHFVSIVFKLFFLDFYQHIC